MPARLRLFISSPGDVFKERVRVELVVDRLGQDYRRHFTLETYRWEYEPMLATGHFQDSIEPPSAFALVARDSPRPFPLETHCWESETMLATGHFQDSIEPPSAFDIVVLVAWSR